MKTKTVRELMTEYDIRPQKKYGQNFLTDRATVDKILSEVSEGAYVLEIGPGLGALTAGLVEKASKVIAYEIDERLAAILEKELPSDKLEVRCQDFMKAEVSFKEKMTVVSNLPYYLTSDILLKLFASEIKIEKIIVMVQKEVADKLVGSRSLKDVTPLTVLADCLSDSRTLCRVDRSLFNPAPQVDSAVIVFEMHEEDGLDRRGFCSFLQKCFRQRRRTLAGNLKNEYPDTVKEIEELGYDAKVRAEQLRPADLRKLFEVLV